MMDSAVDSTGRSFFEVPRFCRCGTALEYDVGEWDWGGARAWCALPGCLPCRALESYIPVMTQICDRKTSEKRPQKFFNFFLGSDCEIR
jgi:hypothetical protein